MQTNSKDEKTANGHWLSHALRVRSRLITVFGTMEEQHLTKLLLKWSSTTQRSGSKKATAHSETFYFGGVVKFVGRLTKCKYRQEIRTKQKCANVQNDYFFRTCLKIALNLWFTKAFLSLSYI